MIQSTENKAITEFIVQKYNLNNVFVNKILNIDYSISVKVNFYN